MDSLHNIFLIFTKISRREPDQSVDKRGCKFNWLVVCRVPSFHPPWVSPPTYPRRGAETGFPVFLEEVCVSDRWSQCLNPASRSQASSPCCPRRTTRAYGWLITQFCPFHLSLESQLPQPSAMPTQNNSPPKRLKADTLIQTSQCLSLYVLPHPCSVVVYSSFSTVGIFSL